MAPRRDVDREGPPGPRLPARGRPGRADAAAFEFCDRRAAFELCAGGREVRVEEAMVGPGRRKWGARRRLGRLSNDIKKTMMLKPCDAIAVSETRMTLHVSQA